MTEESDVLATASLGGPSSTPSDALEAARRMLDGTSEFTENDSRLVARALLAASPSPWRSMESAPKDGTQVLAFAHSRLGGDFFGVTQWAEADPAVGSVDGWFWEYAIRPTHWQPLPEPPSEGLAEGPPSEASTPSL